MPGEIATPRDGGLAAAGEDFPSYARGVELLYRQQLAARFVSPDKQR
jgi:hypothetical protein